MFRSCPVDFICCIVSIHLSIEQLWIDFPNFLNIQSWINHWNNTKFSICEEKCNDNHQYYPWFVSNVNVFIEYLWYFICIVSLLNLYFCFAGVNFFLNNLGEQISIPEYTFVDYICYWFIIITDISSIIIRKKTL